MTPRSSWQNLRRERPPLGLEDFRGQVVLLNIWATWCPPCEEEMPAIQRLYETLSPAGLNVAAVSIDQMEGEKVLAWTVARHLTFPILQDRSRRIEQIYQTTGQPESFIIDRRGIIVKKLIGAVEWDNPGQQVLIRRLLEEQVPPGGE